MDRRKSFEEMAKYLRSIRPREYLQFDRLVSLTLTWFDTHKVREPAVFFENEGKEYAAYIAYLTAALGETPQISPEFSKSMMGFARATR
jgi:hypothetical protein